MTTTVLDRPSPGEDTQHAAPVEPPPRSGPLRDRSLGVLLTLAGLVGLAASAVLLVEKIELLKNPDYVPSCSINPILSCGSIMNSWQADVFGFPNPIMGVVGFAVVSTVGVSLAAGATYPPLFWRALQAGAALGVIFVHWLIFQSLYRIDALCPYCMVVWIVTTTVFWYVTTRNARVSPGRRGALIDRIVRLGAEFHGLVITSWTVVIAALIAHRFWDYWLTVIPR